jgi:ActR/RegA family two-component response regulator
MAIGAGEAVVKILIVDDAGSIRSLLKKRLLQRWPDAEITGYDPIRERRPDNAFPWGDFDIVFLDYELGLEQETGIDWLPWIKRTSPAPYVIMVTGMGSESVAVHAIRQGADDYLIKYDVVTDKLYETVEEFLSRRTAGTNSESELPVLNRADNEKVLLATGTGITFTPFDPASWDIPGYKYIEKLARRLSMTLLAERIEDGKKVVLKVQYLKEDSPVVLLKRFMQELTILAEIDHPHIIRILDRGITDRYFFYAVNYYPQGDLLGAIRGGGVTPAMARRYILQIAGGLSALHRAGIVHRDIKPSNILFAATDSLVITDLGIAKDLSCAEALTSHGQVMGTPFYMSPEQINSNELDHRSDIYSLGILFHEMLTGTLPFPGSSIMEMAYMHAYDTPPRLPEGIAIYQAVMDRMLAKVPEDRYQDLEQFIQDMSAINSE